MNQPPNNKPEISMLLVCNEHASSQLITASLSDYGYPPASVAATFEEAILLLNALNYDVVLICNKFGGNGNCLELGRMVHALYHKPFIYLSTDVSRGATEDAVKTRPSAYLIMPVDGASLHAAIQSAVLNHTIVQENKEVYAQHDEQIFFVKSGNKYKRLDWSDIIYLHSDKNYTVIYNAVDKQEYFIRSTLAKTLNMIIPASLRHLFVQVNRAEAVHINHIQEITGEEVRTCVRTLTLTELYGAHLRRSVRILS